MYPARHRGSEMFARFRGRCAAGAESAKSAAATCSAPSPARAAVVRIISSPLLLHTAPCRGSSGARPGDACSEQAKEAPVKQSNAPTGRRPDRRGPGSLRQRTTLDKRPAECLQRPSDKFEKNAKKKERKSTDFFSVRDNRQKLQ